MKKKHKKKKNDVSVRKSVWSDDEAGCDAVAVSTEVSLMEGGGAMKCECSVQRRRHFRTWFQKTSFAKIRCGRGI